MSRFAGKVLLVTGGGSGLGAATAARFAAEGGAVAVADLDGAAARGVAASLPSAAGLVCDVSDEASVGAAVAAVWDTFGRLDCVFNSAGFVRFTPIEELSLDEWNRMLAVHLTGTFLVCRAVLPRLRSSGGGAIVNMASASALLARPHLGAYAAAKGGVIAFSRQLALDAHAYGVRVNTVAPGSVDTPLLSGVYEPGAVPNAIQPRVAAPDEIAATVCFLLSEEASFMTAALVVADGGATAL
jgi:meso-butanediol dehydrogenase / (S,S)-butanediol dehydrogenase / diacetyl reductase